MCESGSAGAERELAAYLRISSVSTDHLGKTDLRRLLDHFEIEGRGTNNHLCLVHEPLSFSIDTIRGLQPEGMLPKAIVKNVLKHMLRALAFLHTEAGIVHAGMSCLRDNRLDLS